MKSRQKPEQIKWYTQPSKPIERVLSKCKKKKRTSRIGKIKWIKSYLAEKRPGWNSSCSNVVKKKKKTRCFVLVHQPIACPVAPQAKGNVCSSHRTQTEIFTNVNSTAWFRIRPSSIHSNKCWTKDSLAVNKLSLQNEALAKVPTWDYSAACSGLWFITHTILSLTPLTHPHFLLHHVGLSIDISCHISRSHLFSSSDTPSLWVYYLAAIFVNTIMSLVLRAPQTPDHRPVFADSSDSSASSAFQSQKSHFPPSPLPLSGLRGGIFLAAAQSKDPLDLEISLRSRSAKDFFDKTQISQHLL